jgi:hypothetical protein
VKKKLFDTKNADTENKSFKNQIRSNAFTKVVTKGTTVKETMDGRKR